jgi:hypothetical protein
VETGFGGEQSSPRAVVPSGKERKIGGKCDLVTVYYLCNNKFSLAVNKLGG